MKCGCAQLIKSIDAYIAKADNDLAENLKAAGFLDSSETLDEAAALEERIAEALMAETDYIMDGLKASAILEEFSEIWPELKQGDVCAQTLYEIFMEEFQTFMPRLVSDYISEIDSDLLLDQMSKRTESWISRWSEELSSLMQLDSHTMIENLLATALDEGQSVDDLARAIQESGIRDEYYRARRASITELLRSHSVASNEAMMQSPAVEEKEWKHTGNYRNSPRQNHVDMNGQRVKKGEKFTLQGADGKTYYPLYPRDPALPPGESINCHCISQAIVSADVLGLSIEERRRLQAEAIAAMDDEWEKELDAQNQAASGL